MSDQVATAAQLNGQAVAAARLLTPELVAERWGVPRSQVYRLAREERLPCVRLGRYVRFRLEAIEAFEADGGWAADE